MNSAGTNGPKHTNFTWTVEGRQQTLGVSALGLELRDKNRALHQRQQRDVL